MDILLLIGLVGNLVWTAYLHHQHGKLADKFIVKDLTIARNLLKPGREKIRARLAEKAKA